MKRTREKEKKASPKVDSAVPGWPWLTKGQWQGILAGILLVMAGFFVLSKSDPAGRNWASYFCPFLILGGYGVIGTVLLKKRSCKQAEQQPER